MSITSLVSSLPDFLVNSPATIREINQKCAALGLPPAIVFNPPTELRGDPDYQFEGFGVILGIPMKVSFWVHYKPDSPQHVELGRFLVSV
jgi:hypothetical protein